MKFYLSLIALAVPAYGFFAPTMPLCVSTKCFGISGYDCLSPMPEPDTLDAIENLLVERSDARYARDYDRADDIRDQLKREYSVSVYDRDNAFEIVTGRGGGGRGGGGGKGRYDDRPQKTFDFGPNGHDYVRNEKDTSDLSDEKVDEINDLLRQRLEAKLTRDFQTADAIQIQLEKDMDVIVHDGYKEWRGDGADFAYKLNYQRTGKDQSPIDEDTVQQLIKDRAAARKTRDYDTADGIKLQLRNDFNVVINDGRRTWEIASERTEFEDRDRPWNRGDKKGADESDDFEAAVQALVDEREGFRVVRDYDSGDAIVDKLLNEYDVHLQNRERTWTVGPYKPVYRRDKFDSPPEDEDDDWADTVQAIVDERGEAKAARNYDVADDLRDELKNDFNVYVDDKKYIWRIDTGPPPRRGGGGGGGGRYGGGGGGGRGRY